MPSFLSRQQQRDVKTAKRALYKNQEFREALHKFVQNILNHYNDLDKITWKDQNTLLAIENKQ